MMSPLKPSKRRLFQALLLALVVAFSAVGLAKTELGHWTFAYPPAKHLANPTHLVEGVKSMNYCGMVGGVAFGGTATGEDGLTVAGLQYDRARRDGERLEATLCDRNGGSRKVVAPIYDWQLAPIARFAETDQHACFTLFGELVDPKQTTEHRARGDKILNYHPAFENTLMGLRVFQADVLILYPDACDLPKEDGRYLLGAGESSPAVEVNLQALAGVHQVLQRLPGGPFRSYIICDYESPVTFRAAGDRLLLTGEPVWHCWKFKTDDQRRIEEIQSRANSEANQAMNAEYRRSGFSLTEGQLQVMFQGLFDRVASRELLQDMPQYSLALTAEIRRQRGVNPMVYDALLMLMRYSAFFRQFKTADPQRYAEFIQAVSQIAPTPPVNTPTVLIHPD